jgi:DNA invertase Pin-like site-specific DNA recombinase
MNAESKITAGHLQRCAYLYIRQSTLRQVLENTESTQRQYALRQRALALGWPEERIIVIDHDQAQSAATAVDREGFQQLVTEVGLGRAGLVMGLEVSRLARNCADWHRLLEICALAQTLILDEDGLYDPAHFNDRLLLGLKGTMSEAELHVLKARLVGGVISKAQRAELKLPLPVGLVYDADNRVMLDPDQQVQQALRLFFATFERTGSAWATVQAFRREGWRFPKRGQAGSGEVVWLEMTHTVALDTLHNPRYAGAFCFGRTRTWKDAAGKGHCRQLPREQWRFLKQDAHPGYLTWDQFLGHQARLLSNCQARGKQEPKAGPPREGPALLQGLVLCGKCGRAMTIRYHHQRGGRVVPEYVCAKTCVEECQPRCQSIPGASIDAAVGKLLIQSVAPLALEVALNVQNEIEARVAEADRLRLQQVQRAQYEADQARLRYMRVDPNNRLVADTLEVQWNEKLRLLAQAKEEYERHHQLDSTRITDEQKARIRALASDFPKLWQDPKTPDRERKRMARLLLEDVTLRRDETVCVQLRFRGGARQELHLPLPKAAWELKKTKPEIVAEIDQLMDHHTEGEIAQLLNERGWHSSAGNPFTLRMIHRLRHAYRLKTRRARLQKGQTLLTPRQIGLMIGAAFSRANYWRRVGVLKGVKIGERNEYLYYKPTEAEVEQIRCRRQKRSPKANRVPSSALSAV